VVVDREVQVLPAGATVAMQPVAVDPLADRPEATKLLDVDVYQFPWPRTLVAADGLTRGQPQAGDTVAAQHLPHGRGWQPELTGDDQRPRLGVLARSEDPLLELARTPPRLTHRHRRAVSQRRPTALLEASPEPISGRTARAAGGRGRRRTLTRKDQADDPTARLERVTHP